MNLHSLNVGDEAVIGHWVVSRPRKGSFVLTGYPVKMGGRTRFGTLAEIQDDLTHIAQMGCLPPVVKTGF
jgi:hypothetical protein